MLLGKIDERKSIKVQEIKSRKGGEGFKLNEILNLNHSIGPLKLPIPFKPYNGY